MNIRLAMFVAAVAVCACKKETPPPAEANTVVEAKKTAPVEAVVQQTQPPDAGAVIAQPGDAGALPSSVCLALERGDGGTNPLDFTGFSGDGKRFAYSVMSEGAGGVVMTVIEPPAKLVQKLLLDTPEATAQAKKLLSEGGFTRDRRAAELDVSLVEGAARVTRKDGTELFKGTPFTGVAGMNTQAKLWGCDPTGQRAAVEMTTTFESEYGDARGYVLFEVGGGK